MKTVRVHWDTLTVSQEKGPGINNITDNIMQMVREASIDFGTVHITVTGSTGSVTTIEFEPGVVQDLKDAIKRMAPEGAVYKHELAWNDGNGHSHVQAAIMGPSLAVPVRKNRLKLGTWQQIVAINHDNHARQRELEVTITGI